MDGRMMTTDRWTILLVIALMLAGLGLLAYAAGGEFWGAVLLACSLGFAGPRLIDVLRATWLKRKPAGGADSAVAEEPHEGNH
jgi:hypothetical protein